MVDISDLKERHIISVLVDNEFGVLGRVIGLFSGRGYNIDSLTVAEVYNKRHLSRITIVTSGSDKVINQIKTLLERLIPVHKVLDLSEDGAFVERELMLIKVISENEKKLDALRIAEIFQSKSS